MSNMQAMTDLLERKPYTLRAIDSGYVVHGTPTELDHVQAVFEAMMQERACDCVYGDASADPASLTRNERVLLCILLDGPDDTPLGQFDVWPDRKTRTKDRLERGEILSKPVEVKLRDLAALLHG